MKTSMIVAADPNEVIGKDGGLPWHLPEDLRRFRTLTTGHAVVAGRTTHDSIVERLGRPLPGRVTFVASRTRAGAAEDVIYLPSVEDALMAARTVEAFAGGEEVFIIGGAEIYRATLKEVECVYLTRVAETVAGDTVLPPGWLEGFRLVEDDPREGFTFETYERDR
jgi:dihydrofolate reductase